MPFVSSPLFSLDAIGNFHKVLNFSHDRKKSVVRMARAKRAPRDPRTPVLLFLRAYFGTLTRLFQATSPEYKNTLEQYVYKKPLSAFNFFVQGYEEQRPTEAGVARCGFSVLGDFIP